MTIKVTKSRVMVLTAFVLVSAWTLVSAQQTPPADSKSDRPVLIRGESGSGVSAALKNVADQIPAPKNGETKYFRVVSISGKKTARDSTVMVEVEVQDKPFAANP